VKIKRLHIAKDCSICLLGYHLTNEDVLGDSTSAWEACFQEPKKIERFQSRGKGSTRSRRRRKKKEKNIEQYAAFQGNQVSNITLTCTGKFCAKDIFIWSTTDSSLSKQ